MTWFFTFYRLNIQIMKMAVNLCTKIEIEKRFDKQIYAFYSRRSFRCENTSILASFFYINTYFFQTKQLDPYDENLTRHVVIFIKISIWNSSFSTWDFQRTFSSSFEIVSLKFSMILLCHSTTRTRFSDLKRIEITVENTYFGWNFGNQ